MYLLHRTAVGGVIGEGRMKSSRTRLGCLFSSLLMLGTPIAQAGDEPICPDCFIEVHAIVDSALFAQLGSGAEDYIAIVIEIMKEIWSRPTEAGGMGVGVMLGELTINTAGDPWAASTDPSVLLSNVASYVSTTIPINPDGRDVVLMFSGLDFDGESTGLSFVDRLCAPNSVGIVQANSLSQEAVISIANHQLGHLAGARHDGEGNICDPVQFIMSPLLNPSSPPSDFSACSALFFANLIETSPFDLRSCLAFPSSQCDADLNGDGVLNFFDVSAFLGAYNNMDPIADFTGDGAFNFFDVSAFLSVYNAGCP